MLLRGAFRGTLCVALLGSGASAQSSERDGVPKAEPPESTNAALVVHWQGPAECGPNSTLEKETRKLLGSLADTSNVQVIASAERLDEQRYRIELQLSGAVSGQRSLESSECREAVQAAAVVLALAINPEAVLAAEKAPEPEPAPEPKPEPEPPPQISPEPTLPNAEPALPRQGIVWTVGVAGRMSGGISRFPQFGPRLTLAMQIAHVRAALKGYFEPAHGYDLQPTGSYSLSTWGGSVEVCGVIPTPERLLSRLCGGLSGTRLTAKPKGLSPNQRQSAFILAPLVSGDLGVLLGRHIAVVATGALQVPTSYPSFIVESGDPDGPAPETTTAHTVGLGGYGELGLEILF